MDPVRLRFNGFPPTSWKKDEPAVVMGYGTIAKDHERDYDYDTAEWLLATKNFSKVEKEDEKAEDKPDEKTEKTDAPEDKPDDEPTPEPIAPPPFYLSEGAK